MGRFLQVKRLVPGNYVQEENKKKSADEYSFLTSPNVLPEDYPLFQKRVGEYIGQAKELAQEYKSNPNMDYRDRLNTIKNSLINDYKSGPLSKIVERKTTYDNYRQQAFNSKDPRQTQTILNNLKVPLIQDLSNIPSVQMGYYNVGMKDKERNQLLQSAVRNIKAETLSPLEVIREKDPTKYYDAVSTIVKKGVLKDKVIKSLVGQVMNSEDQKALEQRALEEYGNADVEKIMNPDGTLNLNSTYGATIDALGTAAQYEIENQFYKPLLDFGEAGYTKAWLKNQFEKEDESAFNTQFKQLTDHLFTGENLTAKPEEIVAALQSFRPQANFQITDEGIRYIDFGMDNAMMIPIPKTKKGFKDLREIIKVAYLKAQYNKQPEENVTE